MNSLQLADINEVRGVNHKICHDVFFNASMFALKGISTGVTNTNVGFSFYFVSNYYFKIPFIALTELFWLFIDKLLPCQLKHGFVRFS